MSAIFWWGLALVLAVGELLSGTFFVLMLALAAAFTAAAVHLGVAGWPAQAGIFSVLAVSLCLVWYRRRPALLRVRENDLNKGSARWVGRELVLADGLSGGSGRAALDDTFWSVRGPDCVPGSHVRIVAVDGNTLVIEPV